MAYSYVTYAGDGGTTTVFSVPFPYLERKDVKLIVDNTNNVAVGGGDTSITLPEGAYEWISASAVRLIQPSFPPLGSTLRIQRITEKVVPVVDYRDGSILSERDLDLTVTQLLYICQEAYDALNEESAVAAKVEAYQYLLKCQELYEQTLAIRKELHTLSFSAHVSPNQNAAVEYTPETGMLHLYLPTVLGTQGIQGEQGIQGKQGIQGQQGIQGLQGEMGLRGERGPAGETGTIGPPGLRGPQGEAAPAGAQGPQGPMGNSPWSMAFGHFRLQGANLLMDFTGTNEAQSFSINHTNGTLEVTL